MPPLLRQHCLRIYAGLTAGVFGSLFVTAIARAGSVADIAGSVIAQVVTLPLQIITYLLSLVASLIFTFGAYLVTWGLDLNQSVVSSNLVKAGFSITLSIANLGFVLVIIVIAVATILRLEGYGYKQLLKNLVIAAILINFSLSIAGVFIDFTGVVSKFFIESATGGKGAGEMAKSLATAFQPQLLHSSFGDIKGLEGTAEASKTAGFLGTTITILLGAIFNLIFTSVLAVTMVGTGIMVFIRYIVLSILLILMPIAWLAWTLPDLKKHWTDWWSTFFRWCFFLPTLLFFIYLTILLITNGDLSSPSAAVVSNSVPLLASLGADKIVPALGKMIAVIGLLFGGIIAANKLGIAGASATLSAAGAAKGWAIGRVKATGKFAGSAAVKKTARGTANLLNKPGLRWIPGAKTAVAGLDSFGARADEVKAYREKYLKNLTETQRENLYKTKPLGAVAQAAVLEEAVEHKEVGKISPENLTAYAAATQKVHPGEKQEHISTLKKAAALAPHLASQITGQTAAEASKKVTAEDAKNISDDSLDLEKAIREGRNVAEVREAVVNYGNAVLGSISRNSDEKRTLLENSYRIIIGTPALSEIKKVRDEIDKAGEEIEKAKAMGNANAAQIAQGLKDGAKSRLDNEIGQLGDEAKKALKNLEYLEQHLANQGRAAI